MADRFEIEDFAASLSWKDLTVSTKPDNEGLTRIILNNAHGIVKPGEFLAVMGPSGAGKTTLLNYLCKRNDSNTIMQKGEILLNGVPISSVPFASLIGFVPQDDILFTTMTPREILTMTAAFTHDYSNEERKKHVDQTLADLGIEGCADTMVGNWMMKGLSGGEKKRTSVGMELISNPTILFLDEPTTGLDSFTALEVIQTILKLAKKHNRTIIATIHQPSSQIFSCFDKLLLLNQGVTVYNGDANKAVEYFKEFPMEKNYNPADHFLDIVNNPKFDATKEYPEQPMDSGSGRVDKVEYHAPFVVELYWNTWRAYIDQVRNPMNLTLKMIKIIIICLSMMGVFWQLKYDRVGVEDRVNFVFILIFSLGLEAQLSVLLSYEAQQRVFVREYIQNRYTCLSYFLGYNIVATIIEIIFAVGIVSIIYIPLDLNTAGQAPIKFIYVAILAGFKGTGIGLLTSIIPTIPELSSLAMQAGTVPTWLCSGFFVNYGDIPDYFFIKWISPLFYLFESGILAQLEGLEGAKDYNDEAIHEIDIPHSFALATTLAIVVGLGYRVFCYFYLIIKFKKSD